MKKNETVITMGSDIIDFYMDGFDEGKNDDFEAVTTTRKAKRQRSVKERASARRKKTYFKAKSRMTQLDKIGHYIPTVEDEAVIMGMLRSHQLPLSDAHLTCGCSIGNKRRQDTAEQRISEHMIVQDEEIVPV
jgi:histone acetyltransferase (RNA polymerase elongator complex component)